MASIGYSKESINKLMEIVDNYKDNNTELEEKTYIEISNAIKELFEKVNNEPIRNRRMERRNAFIWTGDRFPHPGSQPF
jgi:dissimilatory sulfite reductase (desulfoviridin) alpha/beta subunit